MYSLTLRMRHLRFLVLLFLLAALLMGCIAQRQGVSWADLTIVGDSRNLLVSYNDYMVLIDPTTGQPVSLRDSDGQVRVDEEGEPRIWEIRTDGAEFFTTPVFLQDGEELLVADYNNRLLEVNFPNARVSAAGVTEIPGHVIADVTLADGVLYIPLMEGDLVAMDFTTREILWTFETERGIWVQPRVIDGVVYVASVDHNFHAVDATTGEAIWTLTLDGAVGDEPAFVDGRFFVGTFNHGIFEISLDGEILSEYDAVDWVWGSPVVVDGILYAADLSGYVYALDTREGLSEVWRERIAGEGIRPAPLVTDEYVIVADRGGRVYWVARESGELLFEREVNAEVLSDILLVEPGGTLAIPEPYVIVSTVSNSRILVAFTLENGESRWVYAR